MRRRCRAVVASVAVEPLRLVTVDDDGDAVSVAAQDDRVLPCSHADPIGASVVAHGPFAMNIREEIVAMRDDRAWTFNDVVPRPVAQGVQA